MRNTSIIIAIVTLLTLQNTFAKTNILTVKEQLENLNKFWIEKDLDYPVLKERIPLTDDISLIQMHLSLVEKTLRNANVDNLTEEQKQNRETCLAILHSYRVKGVFPKNSYHSKRTPYFIDKFGTACAVGQLIISTGYGDLAQRIRKENNNDYILELNAKYPEISEWAIKFGFTIDELAWIQPCYCTNNVPGIVNVSCYGAFDGSWIPNVTVGQPPYIFTYEWWSGSAWLPMTCGGCDLGPGDYKCIVWDNLGDTYDFYATITEPSPISASISSTDDNGSCNGSASVLVSGGTPGYTYYWTPGWFITDTITNLCYDTYTVTVTDNNGCISTHNVNINLATKIDERSQSAITIFPNPVFQNLNLNLTTFFISDKTFLSICNPLGQQIFYRKIESLNSMLDLGHLDNGVYSLKIDNGKEFKYQQFIKHK